MVTNPADKLARHLQAIQLEAPDVYERKTDGWDRHRPGVLLEKVWLDRFVDCLPPEELFWPRDVVPVNHYPDI